MTSPSSPAGGGASAPAPVLSAELCKEAAAALRDHQSVLKLYSCPIAPGDLERMAQGGSQDRKDELARLTSNQLSDVVVFARLLRGMIDGIKAGKHPKGVAIEVGKSTTPTLKSQNLTGSLPRTGPATASGLKLNQSGAALRQSQALGPDKLFSDVLGKVLLAARTPDGKIGEVTTGAFEPHIVPLEKVLAKLDAVMVQRLCRDVLRASPVTRGMGMDALRLLSPLADAMEAALGARALVHAYNALQQHSANITALATTHRAAASPHMKGRDLLAELALVRAAPPAGPALCDRNHGTAMLLGERVAHAAVMVSGLELTGLVGQVYRRVAFDTTSGPAAQALAAFVRVVDALVLGKVALSDVFTIAVATVPTASGKGKVPEWPALKPEEVQLLADHLFQPEPQQSAQLLPTANAAPQRSPARLLLTLRAEQALIPQWPQLLEAGQREGASTSVPGKAQLKIATDFFSGMDAKSRDEMVKGLYQMGGGDPEQRARQVGRFLVLESERVLKDGATLGPVRVAFAMFWRKVGSA